VPYYVKDGRVSSGKQLETEVDWVRFPDPIGLMKTYAVAHEEGVSLGTYPPFVEKGVTYSVFKYTLSDKVVQLARSLALLDLDTWKKVKVDGCEVAPVRVACANLPKPAQLGATVDGYSCVGTEVRGTKHRKRVEYFIYTMDSHRDTYEKWGYSLTVVQTGIPPALTAPSAARPRPTAPVPSLLATIRGVGARCLGVQLFTPDAQGHRQGPRRRQAGQRCRSGTRRAERRRSEAEGARDG